MKLSERDRWRLGHVLEAISRVEICVARKNDNDPLVDAALERFVQNIGEMCRGASKELKQAYSEIPWADIVAMRHILVHEYYIVDKETLWDVAEHKIPVLKGWIEGILGAEAV